MEKLTQYLNYFIDQYLTMGPEWVAFSLTAALIVWLILRRRVQRAEIAALLVFYVLLVLAYTVLSRENAGVYKYELELFWSYGKIWEGRTIFLEECLLNVLLFVPLGVLLPLAGKGWKQTVGIGLGFSCMIELLQLVTMRGLFEFDDMIHNTAGAGIGYLLYRAIFRQKK